ncbi:hypothetical protein BpHYR1_018213 [Brachionus plicatilis]|uniref:Uncharacterized protein n=1 Tax=Brachionus plicatilis TaxID=10195 RepID=A0A3M7S2K8_BRAPC|nr:hypothetical protein BpHYR1_018213 [Brachionus plicatilis]
MHTCGICFTLGFGFLIILSFESTVRLTVLQASHRQRTLPFVFNVHGIYYLIFFLVISINYHLVNGNGVLER